RVTRVKNRVQLENPKNAAHRASINDIVHEENVVRTDNGSGCELTFSDDTVVRLAAHTEFDYNRGTRGLNLRNGAVLIQVPNAAVSEPVDVDIDHFLKTSRFITDFPPLRSEKLIVAESQKQQREKSNKTLIGTNMIIFGGGTQVSVTDQGQTDTADHKTAALVTPHRAPSLSPNAAPALP